MKRIYPLLVFLLFFAYLLPAQSSSVSKGEEVEPSHLPDLFAYQDYDTRILKINLLDLVQFKKQEGIVGKIQVAFEQKLKPSWSLNTEISANYFFARMQPLKLQDGILTLIVESRYYIGLKKGCFLEKASKTLFFSRSSFFYISNLTSDFPYSRSYILRIRELRRTRIS